MSYPIKKYIAILLSGMVLVSTWGYSIDQHFCQGNLINTSYFSAASSCSGTAMNACPVPKRFDPSDTPQFHRPPCCQNTGSYVHVDTNSKSATEVTTQTYRSTPVVLPPVDLWIRDPINTTDQSLLTWMIHLPPLLRSTCRWTSSYRC